jgi:hypothetical protein
MTMTRNQICLYSSSHPRNIPSGASPVHSFFSVATEIPSGTAAALTSRAFYRLDGKAFRFRELVFVGLESAQSNRPSDAIPIINSLSRLSLMGAGGMFRNAGERSTQAAYQLSTYFYDIDAYFTSARSPRPRLGLFGSSFYPTKGYD